MLDKQAGKDSVKPVLEVNPGHGFVTALAGTKSDEEFEGLAWLLLDQARILEGALPTDPAKFAERLNRFVLDKK